MKRKFTDAEVALARKIQAKQFSDMLDKASQPDTRTEKEKWDDCRKQMEKASIAPSYEPPWWDKAIAEVDRGMVWIKGYGWMPISLWDDVVAVSEYYSEQEN